MDEYWFRIDATYQPLPITDANLPSSSLPSAKQLVLFRVYNDFYDFQVSLLDNFPKEAGREPPAARILPFMPGPVQQVDDKITATRRAELDEYLHLLCELSWQGARAILEHEVVRDFCALKPGDVEHDIEPKVEEVQALYGSKDQRSQSNAGSLDTPSISAADSQTAFVKIKIFDRLTDDLIALRVHPRVSHGELMDKVQARLGGAVSHLSFRDSLDQQFIGVDSDDTLAEWMKGTDQHVLYAD